jgi:hypothetical protein
MVAIHWSEEVPNERVSHRSGMLVLRPGKKGDPITCRFHYTNLKYSHLQYQALSYVWGSETCSSYDKTTRKWIRHFHGSLQWAHHGSNPQPTLGPRAFTRTNDTVVYLGRRPLR